MASNNKALCEIYPGFSDDVLRIFFFNDSFISLMEINCSFLVGNKKLKHNNNRRKRTGVRILRQEENRSKNFAAALTMRTVMKKKKVLWSIVF